MDVFILIAVLNLKECTIKKIMQHLF
uniref:Uncharacterized protein n=1 Tax=Anguilla anguilla TaxID=7936 RepID=A0A0E9PX90_ANGAN